MKARSARLASPIPAGGRVFFRAGSSVLLCFNAALSGEQVGLPRHFGAGELHFAFETSREHYDAWRAFVADAGIVIEHDRVWKQPIAASTSAIPTAIAWRSSRRGCGRRAERAHLSPRTVVNSGANPAGRR